MRRTFARITITAAATAGLAATTYVQALGLGEIDVSSNLNQRFLATIPLSEISEEDLETVTVTVAPNEAFDRAGIDRAEYLSSLDFQIKNDRGRPRVVVTSSQIAREPVLNLLVQARWSGGKILRDYTILLDPPEFAAPAPKPSAAPVIAAPVIAAAPAPAPVQARPVAPAPAPKPVAAPPPKSEFYETPMESKAPKKAAPAPALNDSAFDAATGSYGPVVAKETLWSIATKVRPSAAISMDQVLLALSEANPVAIQKGTTVSKGVTLRVPSAERMQANSAAVAKAKLAALRGESKVAAAKPLAAAPATSLAEKLTAPKPAEAVKPTAPVAPATSAAPPATTDKTAPAAPPASAPVAAPAPAAATTAATTPVIAGSAAPAKPEPAAASSATAAAATAAPAPATAPAAPTTPAATVPAAAAPAKSPLAQPLPEPAPAGLFDGLELPLGLGALVLAAGAFLLARRRKSAAPSKSTTQFKPGDTSTVQTPVGGSGALGRLGDTTRLSDTQILATGGAVIGATQQLTQPVVAPPPAFSGDSTLILEPEAMATLNNAVTQSAVTSGSETFDRTTQIQVDTLQINLGDNDPISEADFHLAYGLYDEAILLLKGAAAKQPQRADLQVKLAETYFAAGRPMEFQEIAEDLHGKLSPTEWSKIAIMGSQICPDVALFQGGGDAMSMDADFDLAFDEPEAPAAAPRPAAPNPGSIDFSLSLPATPILSLTPTPSPPPYTPPAAPISNSMSAGGMDLDLDDDLSDNLTPQPPAGLDDEASIDFMLGQSITPLGAGLILPNDKSLGFNLGSAKLNFEIPKAGKPAAPSLDASLLAYELSEKPTLTPSSEGLSFSLQDLAVSITPRENASETPDDELNTKLDLARAYVEMGDGEMARSLLLEVQQQGGERHQQEAATLLQRLPS
ncbi:MAG: FimV/HubP family polar landmark protein [Pseudomonadota bacterium]